MQVNRKKIPEKYFCERCEPREVDSSWAKQKQTRIYNTLFKSTRVKKESDTLLDFDEEEFAFKDNMCLDEAVIDEEIEIRAIEEGEDEIALSTNQFENDDSFQKFKQSELDGQNDDNSTDNKQIKSLIKPNIDLYEDKENGQTRSNKKAIKIKELNDELKCLLEETSKARRKISEQPGFKKVKRNEYSLNFSRIQSKLSQSPNFTSIPSSSFTSHKSTISSILAAAAAGNSSLELKTKKTAASMKNMDCLKLVKTTIENQTVFQVKCVQSAKEDQIIGEYIGRVTLLDEYKETFMNRANPFVAYCRLDDAYLDNSVDVCIDTSQIGNLTRFVRKSCTPNSLLKHMVDSSGYIHFMVVAKSVISKGEEVTLPFDLNQIFNQNISDLSNCVCNCETKCWMSVKNEPLLPNVSAPSIPNVTYTTTTTNTTTNNITTATITTTAVTAATAAAISQIVITVPEPR